MKLSVLIVAMLLMVGCSDKKKSNEVSVETSAEVIKENTLKSDIELEVYDFDGLEKFLNKNDDTVYVINFWATWCGPCVKELPYFEKLNEAYKNKKVEVILVSLDFPHLYEKRLKPYIIEHNLKSRVIALNDDDMNTWIPKIDKDWSGAIPATVIYKNDTRKFFEQSFTYEALETEVKQFLN